MTRQEKINAIIEDTNKNYAPYYDVLPNLIRERNYQSGIEIGVFCGGHAEKILETGCELIGIDPYRNYEPGMPLLDNQGDWDCLYLTVMAILDSNKYIHFLETSDVAFDTTVFHDTFDFIFIDGLHTYDQLKKDLENYSPLIRKGGVIACHDYNHGSFPDLTTAIDEFVSEHKANLVIAPLHMVYMTKTWQ